MFWKHLEAFETIWNDSELLNQNKFEQFIAGELCSGRERKSLGKSRTTQNFFRAIRSKLSENHSEQFCGFANDFISTQSNPRQY